MYWPVAIKRYDLKIFLFLALVAMLFSQYEEHFCEIFLIWTGGSGDVVGRYFLSRVLAAPFSVE